MQFAYTLVGVVTLLALSTGLSSAAPGKCQDWWNVDAQWLEMSSACETGAAQGDPLSQVAVAIHLLETGNPVDAARAETLLQAAAAKGYDDAYYWLGSSQHDWNKALYYLEMAKGTGGLGLLALAVAADAHFKGEVVPKDFQKAREIYRRAFEAIVANRNNGVPESPGEWWSNAKWFAGGESVMNYSERYGFEAETIDGRLHIVEINPNPGLSDRELMDRRWKRLSGSK